MITAIIIFHIIVAVVMIIAVLLQVGKGADIGSTFGGAGSQTLFGSAGPATFLTKVTVACGAIFMLTSLYLTYNSSRHKSSSIMSTMPAVKTAPKAVEAEKPTSAQATGAKQAEKK